VNSMTLAYVVSPTPANTFMRSPTRLTANSSAASLSASETL